MKIKHTLILIAFLGLMVSCSDSNSTKSDSSVNEVDINTFNPDLFLGKWKSVDKGSSFIETWKKTNEQYQGMGFSMIEGKKTDIEFLKLTENDGNWTYSARVTKQNGNREIKFHSVNTGKDFIKFSNPEHDDPKSITYKFVGEKGCSVSVEGVDKISVINLIKTDQ